MLCSHVTDVIFSGIISDVSAGISHAATVLTLGDVLLFYYYGVIVLKIATIKPVLKYHPK